jgi:hypothetical protein
MQRGANFNLDALKAEMAKRMAAAEAASKIEFFKGRVLSGPHRAFAVARQVPLGAFWEVRL